MPGNKLLNTGPSTAGWHGYEAFRRCPRMWHLKSLQVKHDADDGETSDALGQGSLIHLMLAHHYGLRMPKGKDLAVPLDALGQRCQDAELREKLSKTFGLYTKRYSTDSSAYKVLAVEQEYKTKFGDAPYSARIDLVLEGTVDGLVYFIDHKSTSKLNHRVKKRYEMSGQLTGQYLLGIEHFGKRFGGVILNHIQTDGAKMEREVWKPQQQHLEAFPTLIAQTYAAIQQCKASKVFLPALSEYVCFTGYGECDVYDVCFWRGPKKYTKKITPFGRGLIRAIEKSLCKEQHHRTKITYKQILELERSLNEHK
jgi:hypothetical protein